MTTAIDVFAAFQRWRDAAKNCGVLVLFADKSGQACLDGARSAAVITFGSFAEGVAQLDKATEALQMPQIGDVIAHGNYLFKVTDVYPDAAPSVRADRAAYQDPSFVLYVGTARLESRGNIAGVPAWAIK